MKPNIQGIHTVTFTRDLNQIFLNYTKEHFPTYGSRAEVDATSYQLIAPEAGLPHRHVKALLLCAMPTFCYVMPQPPQKLAFAGRLPWCCKTSVSRDTFPRL